MASPAEVEDQALWSSDSESSEDESELDMTKSWHFEFHWDLPGSFLTYDAI